MNDHTPMKRLLLLLPITLLLMACPLKVSTPIDNGSAAVPAWLNGTWHQIKESGMSPERYQLVSFADSLGILHAHILDTLGHAHPANFQRMVLSAVGDKTFACIFDDADAPGYFVYRLERTDDTKLTLYGVNDTSAPLDPFLLRRWLLQFKDSDSIIDPGETMVFVKE